MGGGSGKEFMSEYDRTVEEAAKKIVSGEAQRMMEETRAAGIVQDKEFNLSNIDQINHRRHEADIVYTQMEKRQDNHNEMADG